ncbi:MAG: DUF2059 domain-containing protein [Candidatus Protistobacter heckmanni]|nr:DUF2059 domain-containing protein [Candidatus Protistobacter heckmanni]
MLRAAHAAPEAPVSGAAGSAASAAAAGAPRPPAAPPAQQQQQAAGQPGARPPAQPRPNVPPQAQIDRMIAAREMLAVLNFPQVISQVGARLEKGARDEAPQFLRQGVLSAQQLTDRQKELLIIKLNGNGSVERVGNTASGSFTSAEFRAEAAKAYAEVLAKHYTVEEMHVITAFFRTPAGKKFDSTQEGVVGGALESVLQKIRPGVVKSMQDAAVKEIIAAAN